MLPASQRTSVLFSCPVSSLVSAGPKSGRKMKINFALRQPEKCLLSFELYSRNGDTIKVRDIFFKGSRGWVSRRKGLESLDTLQTLIYNVRRRSEKYSLQGYPHFN